MLDVVIKVTQVFTALLAYPVGARFKTATLTGRRNIRRASAVMTQIITPWLTSLQNDRDHDAQKGNTSTCKGRNASINVERIQQGTGTI